MNLKQIINSIILGSAIATYSPFAIAGEVSESAKIEIIKEGKIQEEPIDKDRPAELGTEKYYKFDPYHIIRLNWGLVKDDKSIYLESVDFNRDNESGIEEKIDEDDDKLIVDNEVENWFLKNLDKITKDDKEKISKIFIYALSDIKSSCLVEHAMFASGILEKIAPEESNKKLDELFNKARWGWGYATGLEMAVQVARFGNLGVDACMRNQNGLSQLKTSMASLLKLHEYKVNIDKAALNASSKESNPDGDGYVKELAGQVILTYGREKYKKLIYEQLGITGKLPEKKQDEKKPNYDNKTPQR